MPYQEKWPPRPAAAPPEAPKIWGTGAYNTIIFGTTPDLCAYIYINISDEGRHMAMMLKKQKPTFYSSPAGNGYLRLWPPRPGAAPPEAPKIWGTGAYNTIIFGTYTWFMYTSSSWPPQEKVFYLATFFWIYLYNNKRLLRRQKWVGHACIRPRMVTC